MSAPRPHLPNPAITQVRNIAPKSRGERGQTRDELEKGRLRARTGGFERYVDPAEVLTQPPDSLGYADDADRFNRDTVGMERSQRDAAYAHKEMIFYARRSERAEREEERWQQVEQEHAHDEQALAEMREDGGKWRRNKASQPYHLLSMQYADDMDGEQLRFGDDQTKVRVHHWSPRAGLARALAGTGLKIGRRAARERGRPCSSRALSLARFRSVPCAAVPLAPLQYRASHRAATLASKDNNTGYNPITGERKGAVQTLDRPRREDYGL